MKMELAVQIITGIVIGVVSLGLLCFLFRHIFSRLETKADKEDVNRRFDDGDKRFEEIKHSLDRSATTQNDICVTLARIDERMMKAWPHE